MNAIQPLFLLSLSLLIFITAWYNYCTIINVPFALKAASFLYLSREHLSSNNYSSFHLKRTPLNTWSVQMRYALKLFINFEGLLRVNTKFQISGR